MQAALAAAAGAAAAAVPCLATAVRTATPCLVAPSHCGWASGAATVSSGCSCQCLTALPASPALTGVTRRLSTPCSDCARAGRRSARRQAAGLGCSGGLGAGFVGSSVRQDKVCMHVSRLQLRWQPCHNSPPAMLPLASTTSPRSLGRHFTHLHYLLLNNSIQLACWAGRGAHQPASLAAWSAAQVPLHAGRDWNNPFAATETRECTPEPCCPFCQLLPPPLRAAPPRAGFPQPSLRHCPQPLCAGSGPACVCRNHQVPAQPAQEAQAARAVGAEPPAEAWCWPAELPAALECSW